LSYHFQLVKGRTHCGRPGDIVMADHDALGVPSSTRGVDQCRTVAGLLLLYPPLHLVVRHVLREGGSRPMWQKPASVNVCVRGRKGYQVAMVI